METKSVLKHLLSDEESLGIYDSNKVVTFDDIKLHMLIRARGEDRYLPDHHYRLLVTQSFKALESIAHVLTEGIYRLISDMLLIKNDLIYVIPSEQHNWQDLITYMPPLLLQSAFLRKNTNVDWTNIRKLKVYFNTEILPNFRYTALPSPTIEPLEKFCAANRGFHDLHMHLSGSTETDVAWQDYLIFPDKVYAEFKSKWPDPKVRELLVQESPLFTPLKFRKLLMVARRIRYYLFTLIQYPERKDRAESMASLLSRLGDEYIEMPGDNYHHPFTELVFDDGESRDTMALEALMYIRFMDYISENPSNGSAELFHYYLLILGLCNRLLVQQKHQYGFEQFQKITLNGLREYSEINYAKRFHQIRGNKLEHLLMLEGRFSPKASEKDLTSFINEIVRGWKLMKLTDVMSGLASPGLQLVAHFIKKEEGKKRDPFIRHRLLRIDVWKRATVLALLLSKYERYGQLVTGVDAASSEFDAPPEIFAPAFRYLRRKGKVTHFTYHAGEDFHHIVSGMRGIFEAVNFTDMQPDDRIGHAVASGLSPFLWFRSIGRKLLISQGEWLDNLIFLWHMSSTEEGAVLLPYQERFVELIAFYSRKVYIQSYPITTLRQAWLYRRYEPMLVLAENRSDAVYLDVFEENDWDEIIALGIPSSTKEVIRRYNDSVYRKNYDFIIEVDSKELLNAKETVMCQRAILKFMKRKGIVIEALPTSNVRIGHHRSFKTYHLKDWLKWQETEDDVPDIVIGTDDTGIFATNIFNEYANIYQMLVASRKPASVRLATIDKLEQSGLRYRFGDGHSKILTD